MRLLLASDLHRDLRAAARLVDLSAEADVVVIAGDLATMHVGLREVIEVLREITKPVVLVPGNGETFEELVEACEGWNDAIPLHGSGREVLGQPFYGLGGGVPVTPFGDWSYDFTEQEAADLLSDCPTGAVLVSHSPPKGAGDEDSEGQSIGSEAVREAILERSPKLVVCGHVHASWEQERRIRSTVVVNAGPSGILWDVDAGERIELH